MECPQTLPLLKRLHDLSALPLRGGKALRHPAHLSDSPGSDPPGRSPDPALFAVGAQEGGGGWVVSRSGVMHMGE